MIAQNIEKKYIISHLVNSNTKTDFIKIHIFYDCCLRLYLRFFTEIEINCLNNNSRRSGLFLLASSFKKKFQSIYTILFARITDIHINRFHF